MLEHEQLINAFFVEVKGEDAKPGYIGRLLREERKLIRDQKK